MINRWLGIASLALMLSVNLALFLRDVLPVWVAGQPPLSRAIMLKSGESIETQIGIFDRAERRLGYSWTTSRKIDDITTVYNRTLLLPLSLPRGVTLPHVRVDTDLQYHGPTRLDSMKLRVRGLGIPITMNGEFIPPNEFPCEWQVDDRRGSFVVSANAMRSFGDVIRPFESLTDLEVGQSWRIAMVNPFAGIIPGFDERAMATDTILVEVVETEQITHNGIEVETFVIEAPNIRAWVAHDGRVLRQEVFVPLFGTISLVDEPFDADVQDELRRQMSDWRDPRR